MGTTAEKLAYLQDTKAAIKSKLIEKGVAVSDADTFRSYADKLAEIGNDYEIIENATVDLNFSNGDQLVEAPEGFVIQSATIKKPAALIPENIAEGIDIAGIVGTHSGGGGSGDASTPATFVQGEIEITDTSAAVTIAHNMGVIPDIICVNARKVSTDNSCMLFRLFQCSSAMFQKYGVTEGSPEINVSYGITINHSVFGDATNNVTQGYDAGNTVSNVSFWGFIRDVNANLFTFGGGSQAPLCSKYMWFAISGLSG